MSEHHKVTRYLLACGFSSLVIEPSKAWLVQLSRDLAKVKMAPLGALVQCVSTPIMKCVIDIKNVHRKQSCIITELLSQISFN